MSESSVLPVIPLREAVLFPGVTAVFRMGRPGSLRALEKAKDSQELLVVAQRQSGEQVGPDDLYPLGVRAKVAHVQKGPQGVQVAFEALERIRLEHVRSEDGVLWAMPRPVLDLPYAVGDDPLLEALSSELRERAGELATKRGIPAALVAGILEDVADDAGISHVIAHHLDIDVAEQHRLLAMVDVEARMRGVLVEVQRELQRLDAREDIQTQVKAEIGERQREVYLREQLKAIQRELGDDSGDQSLQELSERLEGLTLPAAVQKEVQRELSRLARSGRESMDAQVIRNYLEWIAELPWNSHSDDLLDLPAAEAVLEQDHFGLTEVKDRVLEYLAVRQLRLRGVTGAGLAASQSPGAQLKDSGALGHDGETSDEPRSKGPILLFSGPPGVGKTSVGKSIAKALGRKYVRIALGGVRDEADIRGHRRTYVGAMPGRIVQALKQAGTKNPVILLDEVDKLGAGMQGDPAGALLEVLDPAQNDSFTDHYLNVPFDLSEVLFVATANYPERIPAPLRDRMEAVEFTGYTEREKFEIARRYLVPRQLTESGLSRAGVQLADEALMDVVRHYTREAGVRHLERSLSKVARKLAREVASGGDATSVSVDRALVRRLLGRPRVHPEQAASQDEVGLATGMYYTPVGGDIMFVEASLRPLHDFRNSDTTHQVAGWGNVSLILTGQLGDVMKESARAALTYAATRASSLKIPDERVGAVEAHIHVPAGAVPKDGPSAGVAMATALISAMSGRKVRRDVAMTGEVTLRGHVLPIGGVKEKLLGAHRAGIKHVLLPRDNEADLEDLPQEIVEDLKISCVATLDEALVLALVDEPSTDLNATETAGGATGLTTH